MLIEEQPAELLARAQDLPASRSPPTIIRDGELEQIQGTIQRSIEPGSIPGFVGANRAFDLAPDVRQLLVAALRPFGPG